MTEITSLQSNLDSLLKHKNLKDDLNSQLRDVNGEIAELEKKLIAEMTESNLQSIKTANGTASIKIRVVPQINDKQAFYIYAVENRRFDFLQSRLSPAPIMEMFEQFNSLPAGIDLFTQTTINIRRK